MAQQPSQGHATTSFNLRMTKRTPETGSTFLKDGAGLSGPPRNARSDALQIAIDFAQRQHGLSMKVLNWVRTCSEVGRLSPGEAHKRYPPGSSEDSAADLLTATPAVTLQTSGARKLRGLIVSARRPSLYLGRVLAS